MIRAMLHTSRRAGSFATFRALHSRVFTHFGRFGRASSGIRLVLS